eukprot:TRINITY_DN1458_c1_g1_i2.p1 TRINITY_DN1458_c1_g1~~TRINITY_DN1458_c1_g1_i2.p1  ORF type:complete len:330 (-),score=62.64 TRINITY_DN1458_c1_g1_i2:469-1458(-)
MPVLTTVVSSLPFVNIFLYAVIAVLLFIVVARYLIIRKLNGTKRIQDDSDPAHNGYPEVVPYSEPITYYLAFLRRVMKGDIAFQSSISGPMQEAVRAGFDQGTSMIQSCFLGLKFVFVHDPELAKEVLSVKNKDVWDRTATMSDMFSGFFGQSLIVQNGDDWKRQRRLMTPAFRTKFIQRLTNQMAKVSSQVVHRWKASVASDGGDVTTSKPVVVCRAMSNYTLEILTTCGFGFEMNSIDEDTSSKEKEAYDTIVMAMSDPRRMMNFYNRIPLSSTRKVMTPMKTSPPSLTTSCTTTLTSSFSLVTRRARVPYPPLFTTSLSTPRPNKK